MIRILAVLLGVCAAAPAHALSVTPITLEMSSAGKGARAVITLSNPSAEPTAVEPTFERVTLDENGKTKREPVAGEHFLLLPLQALLPPGASQTFRLQWVGPPDIPQSESYFVTFNQLPVQGLAKRTGLTVLAGFSVAVNVSPPQARPDIVLVYAAIDRTEGKTRPALTVQNPTAAHALLRHATITLTADGTTYRLDGETFAQAYGNGLLQPWSKRRFILPIDLPPGTRSVTASIDYHPPIR